MISFLSKTCVAFIGNLFNYHANLLNSQKQETKPTLDVKQETVDAEYSSAIVKNETDVRIKSENIPKEDDIFLDISDQVFEEAQELLVNSPWILRGRK